MQTTKMKFNRKDKVLGRDYYVMELCGLSTDVKPEIFCGNYVEEGSTFLEEDTSKVFIMKADSSWAEL